MTAEWDTSLETGDSLVDEQHKRIYGLVGDLDDAENTPQEIMRVLDRLMTHVSEHFSTEEDLMDRTGFPALPARKHRAEHERLKDDAREYVLRFHDGTLTDMAPLVGFLRSWIEDHVEECDRVLVEHVRRHGERANLTGPSAISEPGRSAS